MREFIGVKGPADISIPLLKQYALLFSRVAIPGLSFIKTGELAVELEWLQERGIVFGPAYSELNSVDSDPDLTHSMSLEMRQMRDSAPALLAAVREDRSLEVRRLLTVMFDTIVRTVSIDLRLSQQLDAYPVLTNEALSDAAQQNKRTSIIQLLLQFLPMPDELTPWEQIIDYRSDPGSHDRFLDLRNWMSEVARGEMTLIETEEKLEYLISQYQRHLDLHKMKIEPGAIQTILVTSAELAENIIKFNWGKIAKNLFSLKSRKIALLEGELSAPGSEVAYIVKTKEMFSHKGTFP